METHESIDHDPISREEASEALASTRQSRARVAWSGYPAWYWLITCACLGGASYAMRLSGWQGRTILAALVVVVVGVAYAACRARGICQGWTSNAMTPRETAVLYGPPAVIIIIESAANPSSWASIVVAVLIFLVFAGTGLIVGARAGRP